MTHKIVIADDEPHIRMLIQQALEDLEDEGVALFTACDGEEALRLIEAERPGLVFLDVMMPKINGFDVCQSIKNSPATEDMYVVLLTAKGQEADRDRGKAVGANIYMTKPFDPDELLKKAREVLGL
jgi:two-component system, OmpR family, alkaline phosphatase synthesis response regulator PhoP